MPTDAVYLITRVLQDPRALDSVLIPNGVVSHVKSRCASCDAVSRKEPYERFVKGFDDFVGLNPAVNAFLAEGPPLISTRERISRLVDALTGVTAVRVGFNEWDERPLPEWAWFEREPKLSALFVTASCRSLKGPADAVLRCSACGRQKVKWYKVLEEPGRFSIAYEDCPDEDLFLIEGGTQDQGVCIRADGLKVLNSLGYKNLELVELKLTSRESPHDRR